MILLVLLGLLGAGTGGAVIATTVLSDDGDELTNDVAEETSTSAGPTEGERAACTALNELQAVTAAGPDAEAIAAAAQAARGASSEDQKFLANQVVLQPQREALSQFVSAARASGNEALSQGALDADRLFSEYNTLVLNDPDAASSPEATRILQEYRFLLEVSGVACEELGS